MKSILKNTLLLTSLFVLGSCVEQGLQEEMNAVRLYSEGIETKAGTDVQTTQIEEGVQVGVFATNKTSGSLLDNGENNAHTVTEVDGDMELNSDKLILYPNSASINVYAYAPYVSGATLTSVPFTVKADQSTDANYIASDLIYAQALDRTSSGGDIELGFTHKMAKVKFFLYEGNTAVTLKGATVTINNVATSVTLIPSTGEVSTGSTKGSVKAAVFSQDAAEYVCAALFAPHTFAAGTTFITIKDINGETYTAALSEDKTFAAGEVYTYAINVKPVQTEIIAANITEWSEGHAAINVGDGDIQSITFMSEYVEEYAVAYYDFVDTNDADALKDYRKGQDLEFNYLVRPAEMAARLASDESYMTDGTLTMTAYYADVMTKGFDNTTIDMTIKEVSATDAGILTVVVENTGMSEILNQDFYFGRTSAKAALSVKLNETDYTTKFVQITPKDNDPNVYAEKVSLNVSSATVNTGSTLQLIATVSPSDVTTSGVTWKSSDESVVTVSSTGLITANNLQSGEATITATAKMKDVNGLPVTAVCDVEVTFAEPEVYIITSAKSVEVGGTVQLKFAALPTGIYVPQTTEWSSSKTSLATVDASSGLVTGVSYNISNQSEVANGEAEPEYESVTITLIADGKYKATCELDVTPVYPKSLEFTDGFGSSLEMKVGENKTFSAKVGPDNLEDSFRSLTWYYQGPSDEYLKQPGAASVSVTDYIYSYSFTATEVGTYLIRPRHSSTNFYNYIYAERIVNVEHVYYSSFAFAEDAVSFKTDVTYTPVINTSVSGSLPASYTSYTLTSANTGIVSISGNSIVGVGAGTTTVTATYTDVNGNVLFTDTLLVTVEQMIDRVGWYFYSDGTCTAEYNSSKTVVGIVFSNYDATTDDPNLKAEHPNCTNGLVISLSEAQTKYGPDAISLGSSSANLRVGYSNTKLQKADATNNSWPIIDILNTQTNYPNTSGWYIPSQRELQDVVDNGKDNISSKIAAAGGTRFNSKYGVFYWTSTVGGNGVCYTLNNAWAFGTQWKTSNYYARFIFAF